jgi:hypothetical protein
MKRSPSEIALLDVGNIKTPRVYFDAYKFSKYEIINYVPKNGIHNEPNLNDDIKAK